MPAEIQFAQCSQCGESLDEPPGVPVEERTPCPACGSTGRKFGVGEYSELTPRAKLKFKGRHASGGKPFVDGTVKSELRYDTGEWTRVERICDRGNDWYREHISSRATGDVIRHWEEPLSQHQGHRAAKKRVEPPKGDVDSP